MRPLTIALLLSACGGDARHFYCDESQGCVHYFVQPGACNVLTPRDGGALEAGDSPDTEPVEPGIIYPTSDQLFVRWGTVIGCEGNL